MLLLQYRHKELTTFLEFDLLGLLMYPLTRQRGFQLMFASLTGTPAFLFVEDSRTKISLTRHRIWSLYLQAHARERVRLPFFAIKMLAGTNSCKAKMTSCLRRRASSSLTVSRMQMAEALHPPSDKTTYSCLLDFAFLRVSSTVTLRHFISARGCTSGGLVAVSYYISSHFQCRLS